MEDGSDFSAPDNLSNSCSENDVIRSSASLKHCKACGELVKGHLGPHGPSKCLQGTITRLVARVDHLEHAVKDRDQLFKQHERLTLERQEALLVTIEELEEQVSALKTGPDRTSLSEGFSSSKKNKVEVSEIDEREEGSPSPPQRTRIVPERPISECPGSECPVSECPVRVSISERPVLCLDSDAETVVPASPSTSGFRSFANMVRHSVPDVDGFTDVRRRKAVSGNKNQKIASCLKGASKVTCKPFHVAGISPESSVEDVRTYCRLKNVLITGCYPIRTWTWGTQSMKLFIDVAAADVIMDDDFWPDLVRCRPWMKEPPSRAHSDRTGRVGHTMV